MRLRHAFVVGALTVLATLAAGLFVPAGVESKEETHYLASWSPIEGLAARNAYVGAAACLQCHSNLAKTTPETPMAQAAILPGQFDLLHNQRSEEHTSELQSPCNLVCRLLLEKKKTTTKRRVS